MAEAMAVKATKRTLQGVVLAGLWFGTSATVADEWPQYGGDITNSRHQAGESELTPDNVDQLTVKWTAGTPGIDITSTPAVANGFVYFADWGTAFAGNPGMVYKVPVDGSPGGWAVPLADPSSEFPWDWSRSTPTVVDGLVLVGNQAGRFGASPAILRALNDADGSRAWTTVVDPHPAAILTSSPTVHDGVAYLGVASYDEAFAALSPAPCCSFRGSVVAVDVATGAILWKTYMAPEGFSGNAVWGSSPAIDVARNQLYVATGNNYSAPQEYYDCVLSAKNDGQRLRCSPKDNYFDSVVALDLDTGKVNWSEQVLPFDTWNVACAPFLLEPFGLPTPGVEINCDFDGEDEEGPDTEVAGPDFDFGQGPILISPPGNKNQSGADIVGVGQKSGVYWALDPSNGDVIWQTRTGPGGLAGGHQWGSASDGVRIYTSNANSFGVSYELMDGTVTNAGIFSALDAQTGKIVWQIANPAGEAAGSPAAVANGVVYVCSQGGAFQPNLGNMFAIDAKSGSVLRDFQSGASCNGGAAVADGTVYWGNGYLSFGGTPGTGFYALGLPD